MSVAQADAVSCSTIGERYTAPAVQLGLAFGRRQSRTVVARPGHEAAADDSALVEGVARGDARALEQLYDRYSRPVYSLALRLLADAAAAEDVVQDTFLKLWCQPAAYQSVRGRLSSWLLGVAHHHAIDLLRRRNLEQRHQVRGSRPPETADLSEVIDNLGFRSREGDPQAGLGLAEEQAAILAALDVLSPEQRIPLELAYFRGLTQTEISAVLAVPLGTVKTRMRLGLLQLRQTPELARLWSDR